MQYIALDIGNVVAHVNLFPIFNRMWELGYSEETTQQWLDEYEKPSFLGMTDFTRFFKGKLFKGKLTCRLSGTSDPEEAGIVAQELTEVWKNDCITLNQQMENFIINLKSEGVKTAALSNIGPIHGELLRSNKRFTDLMDVIHFSCDVGSFKPQKLFFQSFLMENEEFAGCVYLDDRIENVRAAAQYKFDSIQFDLDQMTSEAPSVLKKALSRIKERISRGY